MSGATETLGARLKTHPAAKPKYWLIPLGVAIAAGGVFAAVGPWLYPDPRAGMGTNIGLGIFGLLFFLLGVLAVVTVFKGRSRVVHVHEHGIIQHRGKKTEQMLWDEVATLLADRLTLTQAGGLITHEIATFKLKTDTGKKLTLDHLLADISSLGEHVEAQVTRSLLPKVQARLAKGESVAFSPLIVTSQGLARGKHTLPWGRLAGAEVTQGEVRIFGHGEPSAWTRVRYGSLTNAQTLLSLLSSRVKAIRS